MGRFVAAFIGAFIAAWLVGTPSGAVAGPPGQPSDFNGDGYADLAIGVPYEKIGENRGAGGVNVLYGSATGLTAAGDQFWSQDSPGIKGAAYPPRYWYFGDQFGTALASADFDGDGFADLAIGAPWDRVGANHVAAGAVNVLYGSPKGLTADGDQLWSEGNLPGRAVRSDYFGGALTTGDFDGDGFADLAIGAPGKHVDGVQDAGAAVVLFGSLDGLRATGAMLLERTMTGAAARQDGAFGIALAAGDLDADGYDELAIGTPHYSGGGDVAVLYGSPDGPQAAGGERWNQNSEGIEGEEQAGDRFGAGLAIGDFDGDGFEDLAIGSPNDVQDSNQSSVNVLYGTALGLSAAGGEVFLSPSKDQDDDYGDNFGIALSVGDFNGDGSVDLGMAAPNQGVQYGMVEVAYGTPDGLDMATTELWHQERVGVPGTSEEHDLFGAGLTAGDFDGSGEDELAIGAPGESGPFTGTGRVTVLCGTADGLSVAGVRAWTQDSKGVRDIAERNDNWGAALQGSGR